MDSDTFDSLLNIEDDYYEEGFKQGREDGIKQSRLEARVFGIEKGFEKFVEMGKLQAKAKIWDARLKTAKTASVAGANGGGEGGSQRLPPLPTSFRLEKHIRTLLELVDFNTLSTANTDEAVSEFDDRLKRALAKVKIIERMIGKSTDQPSSKVSSQAAQSQKNSNIEDFGIK